jgi:3-oxoacyl-[acyl-carrier-protein] synthase-3
VPVALVDAVEAGRVKPGSTVLMPGFGGGLTLCSHLVKWGDRVTPLGVSDAELPPCNSTALELVNDIRKRKGAYDVSEPGLMWPRFAEVDAAGA